MVDGAGTELPVEFLSSDGPELVDVAGPEVEDVVPGVSVSLLHHHHLGSQQLGLQGGPEAAGPGSDDENSGSLADFASVVTFLSGFLVQLRPERLGLPGLQVRLQLWVEERQLVGFESENLAEVPVITPHHYITLYSCEGREGWSHLKDLRMDLRVAALQKWSKISPARPESTVTDIVLTRLTGRALLSSLLRPSSSPPALSLLRALRRTSVMSDGR